jgi:hypothetical protein
VTSSDVAAVRHQPAATRHKEDDPSPIDQRSFLVRALSRSVAHEIGHYLLGSQEHRARGLMQGRRTADDIMESGRANVRLDRTEIEKLQRGRVELARR